ncbi:MAG: ATP-binding protein [Chloroflexia bacterium]
MKRPSSLRRRPSLLVQFSVLSLVLFIVIGVALGMRLTDAFQEEAVIQQGQVTAALMPPAVGPFLNQAILDKGAVDNKSYKDLETALSYLGGAGLVRVKIWNARGMVVYSDQRELVGQSYAISDELQETLDGYTKAGISTLAKDENVAERGFGQLMEVYTPLRLAGENEVKGAFEGYYDVDDLMTRMSETSTLLWLSIAWGFLFLYISLFAIVRGASNRLVRQARENARLLADTQRKAARLQTINELARSVNEPSLDLDQVFQTALRGIDRIATHNGACITLLDEHTGAPLKRVLSGAPEGEDTLLLGVDPDMEKALLGSRDLVLCADTRKAQEPAARELAGRGVGSFLAVAIALGQRRLGRLLIASGQTGAFDEDDAAIMQGVADQLAVAIENTRLIQEAAETTALRETNRLKDEFVSMVSHELRTPLASIKGYSHTLMNADGHWDDETRQEFVGIIADESDKLTDLVENILEMSRIGAGRLPVTPEPILLSRFCQEVINRVSKQYRSVEFDCSLTDPLPVVEADPRRLEQVLMNLLQNAAKYSGAGKVELGGSYDGGREVVIYVRDRGVGIAPEHLPHLFDRFYRADDTGAGKSTGTGLGLAIAKALVEAQGGRIWVESQPGEGSTFFFTLPALVLDGEGGEMHKGDVLASGVATPK